jgi:hypothetical protein
MVGWFIHNEHKWFLDEGNQDLKPLALPSREFARWSVLETFEVRKFEGTKNEIG